MARPVVRAGYEGETPEEIARRNQENADRVARVGGTGSWGWLEHNAPTSGELTPEMEMEAGDILLGPSAAGQASADPFLNAASMDALDMLIGQARRDESGVLDSGDRARMALADAQHSRQVRGAREQADARAYGSGTAGTGMALQAHLQSLGDANDGLLNNYTSLYNQDQGAALDTLANAGRDAGGLRAQTFGEAFARGRAVDAFNEANLGYQRDVNYRNTERRNQTADDQVNANQQAFQNQEAVRRGRDVVNDAQQAVDDEKAHQEKDQRLAGLNAVTGTVRSVLG